MSKKIAVIWSGEIRNFEKTAQNYKETILRLHQENRDEIDLFVTTYKHDKINDFSKLYNPVHIHLIDRDKVKQNAAFRLERIHRKNIPYNYYVESNFSNLLSMHYMLEKSYSVFEDIAYQDYDYVIRFRDKVVLTEEIDRFKYAKVEDNILIPVRGDWRGGICDVFAIAKPEQMKKYCTGILKNIESYLEQGCYFHAESVLQWHLVRQNVKLLREPITVLLYDTDYDLQLPIYKVHNKLW